MAERSTREQEPATGGIDRSYDEDVALMEAARVARLRASRALTMSQRLEHAHELCAQLSRLQPVTPRAR